MPEHTLDVPLDDDSDRKTQAQPPTHCFLNDTSKAGKASFIITRVRRESRQVLDETGCLMDSLRTSDEDSVRSRHVKKEQVVR